MQLAFRCDGSAHAVNQALYDCHAQAAALIFCARTFLFLRKRLK